MITLMLAAALAQGGQFELVVRFPGRSMGYQRIYSTAAACSRTRNVILSDHKERMAEHMLRALAPRREPTCAI